MNPDVKIGQTWIDLDKRMTGRTLRVVAIESWTNNSRGMPFDDPRAVVEDSVGRQFRIAIRRMEKRHLFRLVRDHDDSLVEPYIEINPVRR